MFAVFSNRHDGTANFIPISDVQIETLKRIEQAHWDPNGGSHNLTMHSVVSTTGRKS
jgi:hypothetical protein